MRVSAKFSQLVSGKSWIFKQRAATSLETSPESTTSFNSAIKVTFEFTCGFNQNGKKIEKAWNFPLRYVCRATKIWKAKVRNRLLERLVNFSRTWKYIPPHSTCCVTNFCFFFQQEISKINFFSNNAQGLTRWSENLKFTCKQKFWTYLSCK